MTSSGEAPQRPQEGTDPPGGTGRPQPASGAPVAPGPGKRRQNRYAPTDPSIRCGSLVCDAAGTRHVHWYDCDGCSGPDVDEHECLGLVLGGMGKRGSTTGRLNACRCACLIKVPAPT